MIGVVLLSALLTPAAMAAAATGSGEVESRILALEDRWRVAQHKNDAEAFLTLLSPDVTFIGTSGSLRDRRGFISSRTSSSIPRAATYEYSELRVRVFGQVAVVTGREKTTGARVGFQGRFTHVWAEQSGVWLLVAIQRTEIARASPAR
jgi:uncharacterized protein (TIGR02246 family)